MRTLQFNYKLFCVATQENNLPLPPYKYIIPLAHAYWNQVKPESGVNMQMMWLANMITHVDGPQYALVKQLTILQPKQAIHCLGQMFSCTRPLNSFTSAITYCKFIGQNKAL